MKYFVLAFALVALASAGLIDELVHLDCTGKFNYLPNTPFAMQFDVHAALAPLTTMYNQWFERAKCGKGTITTAEFLRGLMPSVEMVLYQSENNPMNNPAFSGLYQYFLPFVHGLKINVEMNLPSSCTYAQFVAGNQCNAMVHFPAPFNADLQLSVKKCSALPVPEVFLTVVNNADLIANVGKLCSLDGDCGTGMECLKDLVTPEDIMEGLNTGLNATCGGVARSIFDSEQFACAALGNSPVAPLFQWYQHTFFEPGNPTPPVPYNLSVCVPANVSSQMGDFPARFLQANFVSLELVETPTSNVVPFTFDASNFASQFTNTAGAGTATPILGGPWSLQWSGDLSLPPTGYATQQYRLSADAGETAWVSYPMTLTDWSSVSHSFGELYSVMFDAKCRYPDFLHGATPGGAEVEGPIFALEVFGTSWERVGHFQCMFIPPNELGSAGIYIVDDLGEVLAQKKIDCPPSGTGCRDTGNYFTVGFAEIDGSSFMTPIATWGNMGWPDYPSSSSSSLDIISIPLLGLPALIPLLFDSPEEIEPKWGEHHMFEGYGAGARASAVQARFVFYPMAYHATKPYDMWTPQSFQWCLAADHCYSSRNGDPSTGTATLTGAISDMGRSSTDVNSVLYMKGTSVPYQWTSNTLSTAVPGTKTIAIRMLCQDLMADHTTTDTFRVDFLNPAGTASLFDVTCESYYSTDISRTVVRVKVNGQPAVPIPSKSTCSWSAPSGGYPHEVSLYLTVDFNNQKVGLEEREWSRTGPCFPVGTPYDQYYIYNFKNAGTGIGKIRMTNLVPNVRAVVYNLYITNGGRGDGQWDDIQSTRRHSSTPLRRIAHHLWANGPGYSHAAHTAPTWSALTSPLHNVQRVIAFNGGDATLAFVANQMIGAAYRWVRLPEIAAAVYDWMSRLSDCITSAESVTALTTAQKITRFLPWSPMMHVLLHADPEYVEGVDMPDLGYKFVDPFCSMREHNFYAHVIPRTVCNYANIMTGQTCQVEVDISTEAFPDTTAVITVSQDSGHLYALPSASLIVRSDFLRQFLAPQICEVDTNCPLGNMICMNFRDEWFTRSDGMPVDLYGMALWNSDKMVLNSACRKTDSMVCDARELWKLYVDENHESYASPACPMRFCVFNFTALNMTKVGEGMTFSGYNAPVFLPHNLNFGSQEVSAGAGTAQLVTITNNGDMPIMLAASPTNCGGTSGHNVHFMRGTDTGELALDVGAHRDIQFQFVPQTSGTFNSEFCLTVDDSYTTQSVHILVTGTGLCTGSCTPPPTAIPSGSAPFGAILSSTILAVFVVLCLVVMM